MKRRFQLGTGDFLYMSTYERSTSIDCTCEEAFQFHCDTENLKKISPPGIKVEILSIDLPLRLGTEIKLKVTQFLFIRTIWHIKISAFDIPYLITDTQLKGPFKTWIHEHKFEPAENGVIMTDRIEYELPFGPAGKIADKLAVRNLIEKQFAYRQNTTKKLLEKKL